MINDVGHKTWVNGLEPTLVLIHYDAACVAHPQICSTNCMGLEKLLGALKLSIEVLWSAKCAR
jgi:hypothetical protein